MYNDLGLYDARMAYVINNVRSTALQIFNTHIGQNCLTMPPIATSKSSVRIRRMFGFRYDLAKTPLSPVWLLTIVTQVRRHLIHNRDIFAFQIWTTGRQVARHTVQSRREKQLRCVVLMKTNAQASPQHECLQRPLTSALTGHVVLGYGSLDVNGCAISFANLFFCTNSFCFHARMNAYMAFWSCCDVWSPNQQYPHILHSKIRLNQGNVFPPQ